MMVIQAEQEEQEMFATDGCVIPTITTREYVVTFDAKCEHCKIRGGQFTVRAEDDASARRFGETWLLQGSMRGQTVITSVTEAVQ
jgi:hypothetical protein